VHPVPSHGAAVIKAHPERQRWQVAPFVVDLLVRNLDLVAHPGRGVGEVTLAFGLVLSQIVTRCEEPNAVVPSILPEQGGCSATFSSHKQRSVK
jgi:hypothetical protein